MRHIERVQHESTQTSRGFVKRATGQFYTHPAGADHLISALLTRARGGISGNGVVRICDPFCGDGRLIRWLLTHWVDGNLPQPAWEIALWDLDEEAVRESAKVVKSYCRQACITAKVRTFVAL